MQELVGRLGGGDPEVDESLRVLAYFDALVEQDVGIDALLRAAAVLSGVPAGIRQGSAERRVAADGRPLPTPGTGGDIPVLRREGAGFTVWIDRVGEPSSRDLMVLERLAVGVGITRARRGTTPDLATALDPAVPRDERLTTLAAWRLGDHRRLRVLASVPESTPAPGPTALVPTRYGVLRATLSGAEAPCQGRVGIGPWRPPDEAPASWRAAVVALRLSDHSTTQLDATELGGLVEIAEAHDPDRSSPDVAALRGLDARSAEVLETIVSSASLREAARQLGMHHSSLQSRHEDLRARLGYDPRTVLGRMRYVAAGMQLRLSDPVWER